MDPFVNRQERRLRAVPRLLLQFTVYFFLLALLSAPLLLLFGQVGIGEATGLSGQANLILVTSVASLGAIFVSLLLASRFLDRRPVRDFGFQIDRNWFIDLAFGLFLGAFLMTGIFLVHLAFGWISVTGFLDSRSPDVSFLPGMITPVVIFLCVGVYEEALTRGYQLKNIAEGLDFPALGGPKFAVLAAWFLTSIFFGVLHLGNPNTTALSTINIALAGVLLGVGYILTGKLAIPIGVHITWNFFQGNVFGFPVSGLDGIGSSFFTIEESGPTIWTGGVFGPEAGLLDPIAVVLGSLLTVSWVRFRYGKARIHAELTHPPERKSSAETTASSPGDQGE